MAYAFMRSGWAGGLSIVHQLNMPDRHINFMEIDMEETLDDSDFENTLDAVRKYPVGLVIGINDKEIEGAFRGDQNLIFLAMLSHMIPWLEEHGVKGIPPVKQLSLLLSMACDAYERKKTFN